MVSNNRYIFNEIFAPLTDSLPDFIEKEMTTVFRDRWLKIAKLSIDKKSEDTNENTINWDVNTILAVLLDNWGIVFQRILGRWVKTVVSELRKTVTHLENNEIISLEEVDRSCVYAYRLLEAAEIVKVYDAEKQRDNVRDLLKNRIKKLKNDQKVGSPKENMERENMSVSDSYPTVFRRFRGDVYLQPKTLLEEFDNIEKGIIRPLTSIENSEVKISLTVSATRADGFSKEIIQSVNSSCQSNGFSNHSFKEDTDFDLFDILSESDN